MTILQYRHKYGLTQAQVAIGIGAAVATVSSYENGRRIPKGPSMARIYDFTSGKVTPNDFHGVSAQ